MGKKVAVIGKAGREHALGWKLEQSAEVGEVIFAPGNPGMAEIGECYDVDQADPIAIANFAEEHGVELVVLGGELPAVKGAADELARRDILCFGPLADGARLEGSKAYMKEVAGQAGVPTARWGVSRDKDVVFELLSEFESPWVIKPDGLAGGHGVLITDDLSEAREYVKQITARYEDALIEEYLYGSELSVFALCDGGKALPLVAVRDYKRLKNNDEGPNTGGMGSYTPVEYAPRWVVDDVMDQIINPTLEFLKEWDIDYRGVVYAGIMITPNGPKLLEYNVRFGDPECQVILPLLESDLGTHCREAAEGKLITPAKMSTDSAITVCLATPGYPENPKTGDLIEGMEEAIQVDGVTVFQAGTRREGKKLFTAGGRVLNVTAVHSEMSTAWSRAYEAANQVSWPGIQQRDDIWKPHSHG